PWTLNTYPHKDSLQLLPVRKKDTLNNSEQITISNPAAGEYAIRLLSNQLQTTDQEFSIVYHFIKANEFQWQFPNRKDIVTPNDSILLRWKSTLNETTGKVSISTDKGVSWQVISAEADLKREWIKLSAPDIFTKAILKMETNNQSFISDTFTIGKRIETSVAFNCADSFRIFWNPVPGINKYKVYQLGARYLEPILTISDTGFTLSKTNAKALHYAVAPVRDNISLTRSYTTNYSTQGVGCYIRSFLSYLNNNEGKISLSLGTTYGVKAIRFEKRKLNSFITFLRQTNFSGNDFTITDPSLQNGTNIYRAVLELNNGGEIISTESSVYFLNQLKGLIYPNPMSRNGQLTLLTASAVSFQIIDLTGRVVLKKEVVDSPEFISLYPLQAGMYMYRLTEKDKQVTTGKLLIID
ncbi:MAG: T9SS type A sorting domain-containing protein, partial [Bacteroidota bacterium]